MANRAMFLGLAAATIAALSVPLAIAQSGSDQRDSRDRDQVPPMDMGRYSQNSAMAVDDRYLYVLANGVVMRVDKVNPRTARYLPISGDSADWGWSYDRNLRDQFSNGWDRNTDRTDDRYRDDRSRDDRGGGYR